MQVTLSDGSIIEILNVNFVEGQIDWRRVGKGYTGACVSPLDTSAKTSITSAFKTVLEGQVKNQLEEELVKSKSIKEELVSEKG